MSPATDEVETLRFRLKNAEARVKTLETLIAGRITFKNQERWQADLWDEAKAIVTRQRQTP